MTFDPNAKLSGEGVRRTSGGSRRGVAVGGGLGGVVIIVVIGLLLGVDPGQLLGLAGGGSTGGSPSTESTSLSDCKTGADANNNIDCRIQGAHDSLASYWTKEAPKLGVSSYSSPQVLLFTSSVDTGCGSATSATGPFYCPSDQKIYLDTGFYSDLKTQFGASGGPLAQLYVIAHEWGHHIQNLQGTFGKVDQQATGPKSDSVRLELQADCYAGAWAGSAATTTDASGTPLLEPITTSQLNDALNAAAAIGDDRIQQDSGSGVNSESWTHGSSAERQRWFTRGYEGGATNCDTFAASKL